MGNESWFTSAYFTYVARDGTAYSVLGYQEPNPYRYCRKASWRAFRVDVRASADERDLAAPCYCISTWIHDFRAQSPAWDESGWLRALRRYAIEDTLAALVSSTLDAKRCRMVTTNATGPLEARMERLCRHQAQADANLYCLADPRDPQPTTLALCKACGMPDPWEQCTHIRHPKVARASTDQHGVIGLHVRAVCNLGKDPGGLVPYLCRAGESQPNCFEPSVIGWNDTLLAVIGVVPPEPRRSLSIRPEDNGPT
jgi:hypothetical protein